MTVDELQARLDTLSCGSYRVVESDGLYLVKSYGVEGSRGGKLVSIKKDEVNKAVIETDTSIPDGIFNLIVSFVRTEPSERKNKVT